VDVSDRPIFLPIVPDRNPRTLWACHEVAFISSASVAPFGRFRSSGTFSVLLPFRGPDSFLAALAAFVPLVAFLAGVLFFPALPLPGATRGFRGAVWAFVVAFGSAAVSAGAAWRVVVSGTEAR
jgi:hypothetical protein